MALEQRAGIERIRKQLTVRLSIQAFGSDS